MRYVVPLVTEKKPSILTYIGMLVTITLLIITWSITQLKTTKTPENIFTRQIKLHAIIICELHAVNHPKTVCWYDTSCPEYDGVIMKSY